LKANKKKTRKLPPSVLKAKAKKKKRKLPPSVLKVLQMTTRKRKQQREQYHFS